MMFTKRTALFAFAATFFAAVGAETVTQEGNSLEERTFFYDPYASDPLNCGGKGTKCPTDPNGDAVCSNRVCSIKCDDSCFFSSFHKTCQPSTPSACGVSGTSCPSPPLFGKATCNNGVCGVQCSGSTVYNAQTKTCDIPSTKTQCGLWGDNCPDPANGDGYCYFGTCAVNCDAGYTLDSESNTCTKEGGSVTRCPAGSLGIFKSYENCNTKFAGYSNGVASCGSNGCVWTCNAGYKSNAYLINNFSFLSSLLGGGSSSGGNCVGVVENNECCGSKAQRCVAPANGYASCKNGACIYSCKDNYDYDTASGRCVATNTDVNNCGRCGRTCWAPRNGSAKCSNGQCSYTCNTGYVQNGNCCVLAPSGKAGNLKLKAKRTQKAYTLCPAGESACPIAGSASFATYGSSKDTIAGALNNGLMGYECLDTSSSIESCGGCASTGEGKDCTQIAHASGVGCSKGKCVVLQCAKGYRPSVAGDKCTHVHVARNKSKKHKL